METWYSVRKRWEIEIQEVQVEKSTANTIWINVPATKYGRARIDQERTDTQYRRYFQKREEALEFAKSILKGRLEAAHKETDYCERGLGKLSKGEYP